MRLRRLIKSFQRLTTRLFYNADCCERTEFSRNGHGPSEVSIFCLGDEQDHLCNFPCNLSGDAVQYST